jgi:glycosyltransferase involved in cell wall biosynthesis
MDKISIIIPVYNVEQYVAKCLDSVLNQSYSNLEVLLINDGSTDGSANICNEYVVKDTRIRLFHQENRGLSAALNVGLEHFTGDYLGFVDSDDWVEPEMFETLYKNIKNRNTQISVCSFFTDKDTTSTPMLNKEQIQDGEISVKDMVLYPLKRDDYNGFCGYVWNKLYSAEAVRASKIRFAENIKYGMDLIFYTTLVLSQKCKGVYTDIPLCHYLQRDSAISKSKSYAIKEDILTVYKEIERLLNDHGYADVSYWARGFYCYHAGVIANIAYKNGDSDVLHCMQTKIAEHLDDYYATNIGYPEKCDRMRGLLDLKL